MLIRKHYFIPEGFPKRIAKAVKALKLSSSGEAVREALTDWLTKKGF